MFSSTDVAAVRHVVQRILVPCVFVIGLLGNSVSIYVLTRKRMRCTTNIYLTALAITDIIYLTMALLLSLKHNDYVQRNVEIYWKCYGYIMWLCDACAYISIYIAVCFTIERFIAIRYPLKRQTFCTESLAKKVITGVALFCLFSTISTSFEHQYRIVKKSIDIHGQACNITQANAPERLSWLQLNYNESVRQQQQQQEHREQQREDNEPHLPLQHYMPLPKSPTTPHIDFEGSGQSAAAASAPATDERTDHTEQHQHPHWHTRAVVDSLAATGAVANKENNFVNRGSNNEEDGGGAVGGGELRHAWQPKPDVILRRLKRTVQASEATANTGTTHMSAYKPSTSPTLISLATTPLPLVALTTGWTRSTTTLGWSMRAAETVTTETVEVEAKAVLQRGTRSVEKLKGGPIHTAAETNIPRMVTNFFSLDNRPDLLLDSEFLVSAATPLKGNDVETEPKAAELPDGVEQEQQFGDLLDIDGWTADEEPVREVHDAEETVFFNITEYCKEVTYFVNSVSELGENATYTRLWYFFTLFVFVLIPLLLLGTFNCFLIMLVRRSKNLRGEMTNANSIRRSRMSGKGPRKSHSSSVSQENRITVTLIAVVLLFIICQLPWAIYLIVSENVQIDNNLQAIIGNIFNFLAALNAAANFFLYCVLSDKYRKTVRELITGYKYRAHARNTTATTSLYASTHAAHSVNGSRRYRPAASSIVLK
uniref:Thyrotropin-releasing hormone receptor n=1 Tax=Ceratitis capitata TaxID=7213 RepID=W8B1T9_CERCA